MGRALKIVEASAKHGEFSRGYIRRYQGIEVLAELLLDEGYGVRLKAR